MITSAQNTQLKLVRALLNKHQERLHQKKFVIEGVRLVEEAFAAGIQPEMVLYSRVLSERGMCLLDKTRSSGIQADEVAPDLLKSLADTETPQGILAVLPIPEYQLPGDADFIVLADQVRDPGNLGTLLRTCVAAGVQAVLLTPGTVDAYSPKVVRSAMGAHFRLPLLQWPWEAITAYVEGLSVFHADMAGQESLWQANFRGPTALLIGGEAEGISPEGRALATHSVRIPMAGKTESLNAAVSASVLMFEVLRQRSQEVNL